MLWMNNHDESTTHQRLVVLAQHLDHISGLQSLADESVVVGERVSNDFYGERLHFGDQLDGDVSVGIRNMIRYGSYES
jgi:hypothetical protein